MFAALCPLLLLAVQASPAAAPSAQATPELQLAMTKTGVRLAVDAAPARGAAEIETEFGTYYTPLDPVAVVLNTPATVDWDTRLAADAEAALGDTIDLLAADGRLADLLGLARVLDARLQESSLDANAERRRLELLQATHALASWGALLDPLPGKLNREQRIDALWKTTRKAKGADALLTGGRLLAEVVMGGSGVGDLQLSISELREGLRSRNPFVRQIAARVSGKQMIMEPGHCTILLLSSLADQHAAARDGAAEAIAAAYPDYARDYWVDALLRWDDEMRVRSAWHLVDYLPTDARSPLVAGLAAHDKRLGSRFEVGDLTLTVVRDRDRPNSKLQVNIPGANGFGSNECGTRVAVTPGNATGAGSELPSAFTRRSTTKVTAITEDVRSALRRALRAHADDQVERSDEDWVQWYTEQVTAQP